MYAFPQAYIGRLAEMMSRMHHVSFPVDLQELSQFVMVVFLTLASTRQQIVKIAQRSEALHVCGQLH